MIAVKNYSGTKNNGIYSHYCSSSPQLNSDFILHLSGSRLGNNSKAEKDQVVGIEASSTTKMSPSEYKLEKTQKNGSSISSDIKNDNTLIATPVVIGINNPFVPNASEASCPANDTPSGTQLNANYSRQELEENDLEDAADVGTSIPEGQIDKSESETDSDDHASINAVFGLTEAEPTPTVELKRVPSTSSKTKVLLRKSSKNRSKLNSSTRTSQCISTGSRIKLSKEPQEGAEYSSSDESESHTSENSNPGAVKKAAAETTTTSTTTSSATQSKSSLKKARDAKRKSQTHKLIKIQKLPLDPPTDLSLSGTLEDSRSRDIDDSTLFKGWVGVIDEEKLRARNKMNNKNKNIFRRFFGTLRTLIQGLFRKKMNANTNSINNNNSNLYNNNRRSSSPLISPIPTRKASSSKFKGNYKIRNSFSNSNNYGSQGQYSPRNGNSGTNTKGMTRIHPGPGLEDSLIMH